MTSNHNETLADAIVRGDRTGVATAINKGADPDATLQGTHPLHLATIIGSGELTSLLVQHKADPDSRDHLGRTALHYAAIGGPDSSPEIIETLVQAGADVNARDQFGCTPLDLAAGAVNQDSASALHRHGGTCKQDRCGWVQQVTGKPPGTGRSRG